MTEVRQRVLGEEHPRHTYKHEQPWRTHSASKDRWKEAEELQLQVMEVRRRVLGEEHPDTLQAWATWRSHSRQQDRWNEAEELEVASDGGKAEGSRRGTPGHTFEHDQLGDHILATKVDGRHAEELQLRVMEMMQRVLGKEHPDTLTSMRHLANTFSQQDRWNEAEELQLQVMEVRRRVLGEEHPDTLRSAGDLAIIFCQQGRWKEAEELQLRVMEVDAEGSRRGTPGTHSTASTAW